MAQRFMKVALCSGIMAKETSEEMILGVKIFRKGISCFLVGGAVLMGLEKEVRRAASSSSATIVEVVESPLMVSYSPFMSSDGAFDGFLPLRQLYSCLKRLVKDFLSSIPTSVLCFFDSNVY